MSDVETVRRLDTIIEQNRQIATLLNMILTLLERQSGATMGTLPTKDKKSR